MSLQARLQARRGPSSLDLELRIAGGETLVLVGPNGSGKSTLVDALAGLLPITSGRVEIAGTLVEGEGVRLPPPERGVALMPQGLALFPHMSAVDNVAYGLRARGHGEAEARAKALEWLARLEIAEVAERSPSRLSGGQAQRVALARAVITEPSLLLLDEPLSALDVSSRRSARRLLHRTLRSLPGAKLVITHDARDLAALGDRVAVLEGGRIVREGSRAECLADPGTGYLLAMLCEQGLYSSGEQEPLS